MVHFSCDLCGKDLTTGTDIRFAVRVETFAADNPSDLTDDDLDADHVEEMARLLAEQEDGGEGDGPEPLPVNKKMRFDLCPHCYRKFLADPLGRETVAKLHFSKN